MSAADVTLQPVAMILVTERDIYSPNDLLNCITLPYADFLRRLADGGQAMLYNPDPKPTPASLPAGAQLVTAYLEPRNWRRGWLVVI